MNDEIVLQRGWCYHLDCDEDVCRCWRDEKKLEKHLEELKAFWNRMNIDINQITNGQQKRRRVKDEKER